MTEKTELQYAQDVIRRRKTTKVMSEQPLQTTLDRNKIASIVESAHWAPFHRPCEELHRDTRTSRDGCYRSSSIVPWRVHALDAQCCRNVRDFLEENNTGKMPMMLASAEAVLQFTWLPSNSPEFIPSDTILFEPTLLNMEHIAAASAAVQNVLVAATACGLPTYWSSGGALRFPSTMKALQIPPDEILIGSIFFFPTVSESDSVKVVPSKLRDKRGSVDDWFRWIETITA